MTPHGCIQNQNGFLVSRQDHQTHVFGETSPSYTHISYVILSNCYSLSRKCFVACRNDRAFRCTQTILHIDLFLTFKNAGALIEVDRISLHTQRTNHRTNISNTISCRNLLCCKFCATLKCCKDFLSFRRFLSTM